MSYPLQDTTSAVGFYAAQHEFFKRITRAALLEAGIRPGMRVLDVGCGGGDVVALLAEIAGPNGEITGIDVSGEAVAAARARLSGMGVTNVEFLQQDANTLSPTAGFDAAVGRFVLMYAADPAGMIRTLSRSLKPGGVMLFLEPDYGGVRFSEPVELCSRTHTLIEAALQASGADTRIGLKLYRLFQEAGMPRPDLRCAAEIGGGPEFGGYAIAAGSLSLLAPLLSHRALADPKELDFSTLAERMRAELDASGGVAVFPSIVSAWARTPAEG